MLRLPTFPVLSALLIGILIASPLYGVINPNLQPAHLADRYINVLSCSVTSIDKTSFSVVLKVQGASKGKFSQKEITMTAGDKGLAEAIPTLQKGQTRNAGHALSRCRVEEQYIIRKPAGGLRTPGVSLLVSEEGRLVMHTTDPTKARLVSKMHDSDKAKSAGKKYGNPKGSVLAFFGKAELNGVVFDNVLEGGIMVSPEQRATWKNVSYGKNNLAGPEKLYWDIKTENE